MSASGLLIGSIIAIVIGTAIVSAIFGKLEGVLTCLLLTVFQGIYVYNFKPLILESQPNVSFTPGITIGIPVAILILIFVRNKNIKIGAASYLIGFALIAIPIIFSLI